MEIFIFVAALFILFLWGIRIVRPTHRGLIERMGKYNRLANPGFHWIIPVIDRMFQIDVTEQMVDAEPQEIITNDNLNARVDAQIYFKVKSDEENVKASTYNVYNYRYQIVNLARTTLRNIIGTMTLACAAADIIRAGAFWMSSSNATMSCGLFISGDHTTIAGLIVNDQVQYTITLQFT